jgi:[ribosomal protein S5]-alanine N-acetyltransferase
MSGKKFTPFPTLRTERLTLRQLTTRDKPAIFKLRNDENVSHFILRARLKDKKDAAAFIRRINGDIEAGRLIYWGVGLNPELRLIGTICLWNFSADEKTAELGYELLPAHHGRGLAVEAVRAVMDFGFSVCAFETLEAFTHKENQRSQHLLEKFGFRLVPGKTDPDNPHNAIYSFHRS